MGRPKANTEYRKIDYKPLPSQQKFHDSPARFKGFSGPIGSGKSQALCQESIRLSYLNPGRQGLIGAPTYPMLRDATLTSFMEVLNANGLPHELNKAELVLTMKDTRSRIYFRAVDDFERLRGTNLAWFGLDELTYTSEESWLRLEGRLRDPKATRLCGFAVWTPKGFDWVYRRFIKNTVSGYDIVLAQPYENSHVLDAVPDFYDRLKGSYDAKFFEQEVLGQYLNVQAGVVYQSFIRSRNVKEMSVDPERPLFWALDFNVDPMSSIVAQKKGDQVRVLDEGTPEVLLRLLPAGRRGGAQIGEGLLGTVREPGRARMMIAGDPGAGPRHGAGAADLLTLLEDQHGGAALPRRQRRRERGGTRADHDHVGRLG